MRKKAILLACILMSTTAFGQNENKNMLDEINVTPPAFMGEMTSNNEKTNVALLNDFLSENLIYPQKAIEQHQQGVVIVQFKVNSDGIISKFNVVNSVSNELDNEAIRLISHTDGMWKPGMNNNKTVAMEKEVAMKFELGSSIKNDTNKDEFYEIAKRYFIKGNHKLLVKNNSKAALRSFNTCMKYQPYDKAVLMGIAFCNYNLGKIDDAKAYWQRIKELGGEDFVAYYLDKLNNEYKEEFDNMIAQLNK